MSARYRSESEEDDDFSGSEDEWLPEKRKPKTGRAVAQRDSSNSDSDGSSDASEHFSNEEDVLGKSTSRKPAAKSNKRSTGISKIKRLSIAQAKHLSARYRTKVLGAPLSKLKKKDSDSSGDEHLVDPNKIDLNSKFFDSVEASLQQTEENVPTFQCNAGVRLSDSSDGESEPDTTVAQPMDSKKLIANINQQSQAYVNFQDFTKKLEQAKNQMSAFAGRSSQRDANSSLNVNDLLAMGEQQQVQEPKAKTKTTRQKVSVKVVDESDSDWEEVEDEESTNAPKRQQQDVQITVASESTQSRKRKCPEFNMEACFKRMVNRDKRYAQQALHKATIAMGMALGNYTNTTLNNSKLMAIALTLVPSDKCYPKDRTNIQYYQQILQFYCHVIDLKDKRVFVRTWKHCPLDQRLRLQLLSRKANCKHDYILLFIILLRSIGVQCRMVLSLQVPPKKVAQGELLKIERPGGKGTKANVDDDDDVVEVIDCNDVIVSATSKTRSISKGSDHAYDVKQRKQKGGTKRKVEDTNIPQLDGGIDQPAFHKKRPKNGTNASSSQNETGQAANDLSPRKTRKQRLHSKEATTATGTKVSNAKNAKSDGALSSGSQPTAATKTKSAILIRKDYRHDSFSKPGTSKANVVSVAKVSPKQSATSPRKIVKIERFTDSKTKPRLDRRVLSTDDELPRTSGKSSKTGPVNLWLEVYAEEEEQWITVDVVSGKVHCQEQIVQQASSPMLYVLAWNNDGSIKDVSARYCPQFATTVKKLRIEQEWMDETLLRYRGTQTIRDHQEDRLLNRVLLDRPLPTAISEYKNHPLYALKRHLLKFEGIYPPDAPTLGFVRQEPVYARECVQTLHSREIWLKQARTVKLYETPYKVVSARPKYDRASGQMLAAQPLELFGMWQTEDYDPPTAEDGIVPRNAYGNVELFKACMLPKKTVHLQLPGLNRICKKLRIDCAQAVTGFDFHGGSSHPVYDGFVVCEEYKDLVVDAWYQEQEAEEQRGREKYEKRVYGNWKKLIKGLLIRRKLQHKYNFDNLAT